MLYDFMVRAKERVFMWTLFTHISNMIRSEFKCISCVMFLFHENDFS